MPGAWKGPFLRPEEVEAKYRTPVPTLATWRWRDARAEAEAADRGDDPPVEAADRGDNPPVSFGPPYVRVGRRVLYPEDAFIEWMKTSAVTR